MSERGFEIAGTFDIECSDWSVFQVGATHDGKESRLYYDGDEMIDAMRGAGGVWFGHAAGIYDSLYILERLRARGIAAQIDKSQHRVTRIVAGRATFRDSYSIWPVPLDDIAGAVGEKVPELPWPCICGRECGGYCQIKQRAAARDADLEAYVVADTRVLYKGLTWLRDQARTHGIALRGTLGQTSWIAAQTELGVPDSTIPWELWRHAKRGDKGGRAEVIRPYARGPGLMHDICNAYPGQLAKAHLPIGYCAQLGSRRATSALSNGTPGVYHMTVIVPDSLFLPPLSWYVGGRLLFPTGEFSGSWALPEIACALERGVAIKEIHSAIVWEMTAPIFAPLVERWYAIRRGVGRKTPFGQWIGRLAKALTGKFAEKPERARVTMHPSEIKVCTRKGPCRNGCSGRCGAYRQLDMFGHIFEIPYQRLGPSAYPQWSAYLRAMTRVQWLEQAERYGESLCMGNTDSLWTLGRAQPDPLGDDLGQWEYQHAFEELEAITPAMYAFRNPAEATMVKRPGKRPGTSERVRIPGKLHVRGIPGLTEDDWKRGHGVHERGVVTFGNSVKRIRRDAAGNESGSLFTKRVRHWTLPNRSERVWYGSRRLGASGVTYPGDADELREIYAPKKEP